MVSHIPKTVFMKIEVVCMFYPDPNKFTRTVKILLVCIFMLLLYVFTRFSIFLLAAITLLLHVFSFNPWRYCRERSKEKSIWKWEGWIIRIKNIVIAIVLVMMLIQFNGIAEANMGIIYRVVARSPLPSLVMKPFAAASLVIPSLIRKGSRNSIKMAVSNAGKIGSFIKENANGLAVGMVIASLWNNPDKSSRLFSKIYRFIPVPIRLILMMIVVGYLSPWIKSSICKMKKLIGKEGSNAIK